MVISVIEKQPGVSPSGPGLLEMKSAGIRFVQIDLGPAMPEYR